MNDHCWNRRDFLRRVGAGSIAGAIPLASAAAGSAASSPNIIFILADDLGYGDLGYYGQKLIRTPRIDQAAREGMRFTQCYSGSPVCAPSRNSLMTGQHTGHTRIRANMPWVGGQAEQDGEGQRRISLEPKDFTVAELLKRAGYATAITGKWGMAEPDTPGVPNRKGFDEWLGFLNQNHAVNYYTDVLWRNENRLALEGNRNGARKQYVPDLFTEFALDFIRKHRATPFFLYLAYTIPHETLEVPDQESYAREPWPERARIYAAMVGRMDRYVGRVLDLLKELGIDNNTLVFFTSDNGAPKKDWGELFSSRGQFRGQKADLYEGGIRVPMIVRRPGVVPAGTVNNTPWYFADFLPTAASLVGLKSPPSDGADVSPLFFGKAKTLPDRFMYWEHPFQDALHQAVRRGRWKAVRNGWGKPLELYDLEQDPMERNDVAPAHPEIIERFESYLKSSRVESPNWPTPIQR